MSLVSPTVPPVLDGPLQETLTRTLGSVVTLLCEASGVPVPSTTWFKDGTPIGEKAQQNDWVWRVVLNIKQ